LKISLSIGFLNFYQRYISSYCGIENVWRRFAPCNM
jgi:hypothetical protein